MSENRTNFDDDIGVLILSIVEDLGLFTMLFHRFPFLQKTLEITNVFLKFLSTVFIFRMVGIRGGFV